MSFSALRKRKNNLDKLKEAATASAGKGSYQDDRFWTLTRDKANNGFAIIRFLDVGKADQEHYGDDAEATPWVHYYTHGFKNAQGRWFSTNCLTSIGEECPVCQANSVLWNTGDKKNQQTVRDRKRKEHYVANIYVVKDSKNPECEGKVFLYRFGPSIFAKIKDAMSPEFEDEVGFIPFDFWEGANFKLKAREQDNYVKYDKSEFEAPGPLFEDDEEMEAVWEKCYPLHEFVSKDKFEDFETIKTKFERVVGGATAVEVDADDDTDLDDDVDLDDDIPEEKPKAKRTTKKKATAKKKVVEEVEDDDDDDALDYFRSKLDDD